ncbi:MAG: metal ABC transporter ATP-binding protein [Chloroflexota bacterium]
MPILNASGVMVRYDGRLALDDISFALEHSERVAVVGPNGAGKSTLFKVIAGILSPDEGVVHVYGQEPDGHICIAYVPQRSNIDWDFPVTVSDVVLMGRVGKLGLVRQRRKHDLEVAQQALGTVKLQHLSNRQIGELSGGQQQRLFIARALAQEAELMLMDEPLNGLDVESQETILALLSQLKQQGVTIVVALHDLTLAQNRFDRVMLLNRKMLGFGHADQVFTSDNLIATYGDHLHFVQTDEGSIALSDTCCGEGHDHV